MLRRAGVKLSLLSVMAFLFLWGCGAGGGDAYRSEIYDSNNPDYRGFTGAGGTASVSERYYCGATGYYLSFAYSLQILNGQIRIGYCQDYDLNSLPNCSVRWGNWAPLCPRGGGKTQIGSYSIETRSDNYMRLCYSGSSSACGNWIKYRCSLCPPGYTLHLPFRLHLQSFYGEV